MEGYLQQAAGTDGGRQHIMEQKKNSNTGMEIEVMCWHDIPPWPARWLVVLAPCLRKRPAAPLLRSLQQYKRWQDHDQIELQDLSIQYMYIH